MRECKSYRLYNGDQLTFVTITLAIVFDDTHEFMKQIALLCYSGRVKNPSDSIQFVGMDGD